MNKTCCIAVASDEYLNKYRILQTSIQKHLSNIDSILYYTGITYQHGIDNVEYVSHWLNNTIYTNELYKHCSIRPQAVLDAFSKGYEKVILIGADTEWFAYPKECVEALDTNECFVTMYTHEPYPDEHLYGNNIQVVFNGQINADCIAFKNTPKVIKWLEWVDKQTKNYCKVKDIEFVDQLWFSTCFSMLDNVYICRHLGYNVASYNAVNRGCDFINKKMKDQSPLVLYHYDGLEKGKEELVSKHQNRYKATNDWFQFLKHYNDRL